MGIRWNRLAEAVLTSTHNLCFEQKFEKYQSFLPENFQFLEVKFSIYLNWHVCVMHLLRSTVSKLKVNKYGYMWYTVRLFYQGDEFCYLQSFWGLFYYLNSSTPGAFWKGVNSKMKECAPRGSTFFHFRVDPFSEGEQNSFDKVASPESIHSP